MKMHSEKREPGLWVAMPLAIIMLLTCGARAAEPVLSGTPRQWQTVTLSFAGPAAAALDDQPLYWRMRWRDGWQLARRVKPRLIGRCQATALHGDVAPASLPARFGKVSRCMNSNRDRKERRQ